MEMTPYRNPISMVNATGTQQIAAGQITEINTFLRHLLPASEPAIGFAFGNGYEYHLTEIAGEAIRRLYALMDCERDALEYLMRDLICSSKSLLLDDMKPLEDGTDGQYYFFWNEKLTVTYLRNIQSRKIYLVSVFIEDECPPEIDPLITIH